MQVERTTGLPTAAWVTLALALCLVVVLAVTGVVALRMGVVHVGSFGRAATPTSKPVGPSLAQASGALATAIAGNPTPVAALTAAAAALSTPSAAPAATPLPAPTATLAPSSTDTTVGTAMPSQSALTTASPALPSPTTHTGPLFAATSVSSTVYHVVGHGFQPNEQITAYVERLDGAPCSYQGQPCVWPRQADEKGVYERDADLTDINSRGEFKYWVVGAQSGISNAVQITLH